MSEYILDTDHVTLFQHGFPNVVERVNANRPNIAVTIITTQEQLRGRFNLIKRALQTGQPNRVALAYANFSQTIKYFCSIKIIDLSESAYDRYTQLRSQGIRIGTQDLLIGAIVLSENNAILVTRNQRDFAKVPGLVFEDWTLQA